MFYIQINTLLVNNDRQVDAVVPTYFKVLLYSFSLQLHVYFHLFQLFRELFITNLQSCLVIYKSVDLLGYNQQCCVN